MADSDRHRDPREYVHLTTGSRLHFGLFDVKPPYGGVGLMVDHPQTSIRVVESSQFQIHPTHVQRIVEVAERLATHLPPSLVHDGLPKCSVSIESAAQSHKGLGSGTQLALAATMAMVHWFGLDLTREECVRELARRGRRSLIGSIGFFEGGLIAEDGTASNLEPAGHWSRAELPNAWRIVLACPPTESEPVCGELEGDAFARMRAASSSQRAELTRLGQAIMAYARQSQFELFSDAVGRFNRQSGELFADYQGGCFHGEAVATLVRRIELFGCSGVGQSSWGPTVFAFCESQSHAEQLARELGELHCRIVKPFTSGYTVSRSPSTSCK